MVGVFTRGSFAMKHALPRRVGTFTCERLAMIHVSAGIAGDWILARAGANMRADSGMKTDSRLSRGTYHCEGDVSGLLQY